MSEGRRGGGRAWIIWFLGALCFGYAFFHRVSPSVMVDDLMRTFAVGGAVLGNLSALYFYVYAGLQVPIGMALDRLGPRRMLTGAIALAACGALLFSQAETLGTAYAGRLMVGAGSAVGFVATLKLIGHWFPANRFASLSGLTMLVAMSGGILGQAPLAAVVEAVGWRDAVLGAAVFGLALSVTLWLVVRDRPEDDRAPAFASDGGWTGLGRDLAAVVARGQSWVAALYAISSSAPMLCYAGLWGVPHLMLRYGLERAEAGAMTSILLMGWALGSPLAGWIADRIGRRRLPCLVAALLALLLWPPLIYLPGLPVWAAGVLLALVGAVSSTLIVCFAAARESVPPRMAGALTGFINMGAVAGGALMQPLVGLFLDLSWDGRMEAGVRAYDLADYDLALLVIPACTAAALLSALLMRETGPGR